MTRKFKLVDPEFSGIYTGKTPKQAAQKAYTQLKLKSNTKRKINFSIKETTMDSTKKTYKYFGECEKLKTPQVVQYGAGKNATEVTYTHKNKVYRIF